MAVKSTFMLDDVTMQTLRKIAARENKPQSLIVREAVAHYAARDEQTTPKEREQWLSAFDELVARVAPRSPASVKKELADVKRSRREGWSRGSER